LLSYLVAIDETSTDQWLGEPRPRWLINGTKSEDAP
jgi:hypothetical protein